MVFQGVATVAQAMVPLVASRWTSIQDLTDILQVSVKEHLCGRMLYQRVLHGAAFMKIDLPTGRRIDDADHSVLSDKGSSYGGILRPGCAIFLHAQHIHTRGTPR